MKHIKYINKLYCKAYLAILKYSAKYLLIFLKSNLLFLFINKNKLAKYKQRKIESYRYLLDYIRYIKEFTRIYRQSLSWIQSKDFISQYDTIPYPPLLNPQTLNYSYISARLAWDLNLPLPPNYDFIYIRIYACASGAMPLYLKKCGFYLTSSFQDSGFDDYATFRQIYSELQNNKNIILDLLVHKFSEKFLHLVAKNVPLLIVTRDPISIMKTLANHTGPAHNKITRFNLTFDYNKVLAQNLKYDNGATPQVGAFTHSVMEAHFATLESCLVHFKNNNKIIIDTANLAQDKVYETFVHLSKKLHFTLPNKSEFANIENTTLLLHWLNITLVVCENDVPNMFRQNDKHAKNTHSSDCNNGIEIVIATPFMINVYYDANDYELLSGIDTKKFKLYIKKQWANILYKNTYLYNATLEYLHGFCVALEAKIALENQKQISETDILHYFAENVEIKEKYKNIFNANLITIHKNAKAIVDSWGYYKEFIK